ncbi:hypothetical protein R2APBS1_3880 [Rhodanobacter denitrificans]|uniref:Piwi domain-containing protein n=2 Tax=Rhodanobacteraceae TaxID=1775411 RepID=M4NTZ1_9GAMM|nr:hypothetical protein R2APBS1_3880 [Rhodanobacter denitrificans]
MRNRRPALSVLHIEEPELEFRFGQRVTYPRDGLYLFGPVDAGAAPRSIRYGFIGTPQSFECFQEWASQVSGYIPIPTRGKTSKESMPHHVPFPGFAETFFSHWSATPAFAIRDLSEDDLRRKAHIGNRHEAIKELVDTYVDRLIAEIKRLEDPPQFWYAVIPEFVYELGRPQSAVSKADRVPGKILVSEKQASKMTYQASLFAQDEKDAEVYQYEKNFRRQLKARLLDHKIVTQIVRETTLAPGRFLKAGTDQPKRRVEDPATIAWKLSTGSYYKSGGRPWQLAGVRPGVCYVGLVYKQQPQNEDHRYACCAAQMFLADGEGVVFRGALGPWYNPDTRQYHLDADAAYRLASTVIAEYKNKHDCEPTELFIHAQSRFDDAEWEGFHSACSGATNPVGVQIGDAWDDLKLFRPGNYPVIRGTALIVSARAGYLWTSGYVPRLDTYMGPDTPNPLHIVIRRGDASIQTVMADVLALSKINFNSCLFNDRLPVTLRFANAIGEILTAAPLHSEPMLPFKHYI